MGSHGVSGSRILLVEDEFLFGVDLAMTLEERGFVVSGPLRCAATAEAEIAAGRVDLALLDIELGQAQTSFGVARALQGHGVPYIFMTGHAPSALELPADLSCYARMTKPVDVPNLLILMREALRPASAGQARTGRGAPTEETKIPAHRLA